MTLAQFFMILLGRDVYTVDSAAIKVLPKKAFNCYFPIPFRALRVGFDDWIKIWVDGKGVYSGRHDKGFAEKSARVELPAGEVSVLVKLSNFDNMQWRLWAFALRLEDGP